MYKTRPTGKTDTTRAALTATAESMNMKEWEGLNDLKLSKETSDGAFVYEVTAGESIIYGQVEKH